MLLQQPASPGPSGTASPKPYLSPKPSCSPLPSRFAASPSLSDRASSSNSPRFSPSAARKGHDEQSLEALQAGLKDGWTVHIGRDGRLYYCNHVTRTAGWLPPAEGWPGDLPYGWERALDARSQHYYINHINKTTTYVAPEGSEAEPPPAPRTVRLARDPQLGFGFVAGSERPVLVRFVTDGSPSVGKLEPGDQILSVNGEDVSRAARDHVIGAVRACATTVDLTVCQPAVGARRSALLTAAKRARLRARPPRVRFADSVQLNGSPMYPASAFSLGDLCLPPMANVLKVYLENGQTKSFRYDAATTVGDVVASLRDKLRLGCGEHFGLVLEHVKGLRRNKLTLLDPKESLARIASRPGAHRLRCLFRAVFLPAAASDLAQRDAAALDYLYLQCTNDVAADRFAPELRPDAALRLAALHAHQHAVAHNVPAAKLGVKTVEAEFGLERFVPASLLEGTRRRELRRLFTHYLRLLGQMTGSQRQLTQLQAKLHYLDIVSALPSYGAKCFSSAGPERALLVSGKFGLSQIVGGSSVPQPLASVSEVTWARVRRRAAGLADVTLHLARDRVLDVCLDERDAVEMTLYIAGYYRQATGQELPVDMEREPVYEDIAPPYLSQHQVVPAGWSYIHHDHPETSARKHYAIFSMPPPYHAAIDANQNTTANNRNHSNSSSPSLGHKSDQESHKDEDFRLFDGAPCYIEDGMGFDLNGLTMDSLELAKDDPRLVEARNEAVLRRVAEMQELVENSEQYLTENGEEFGRESNVDRDSDDDSSKNTTADDAPGILKHSDSLLLLTETINQGLNDLSVPETDQGVGINRKSQGLSAILSNCGLTDALLALGDMSQSESDNDSLYTPTDSPNRKYHAKPARVVSTQRSPEEKESLKEYLKQLRERSRDERVVPCVEVSPYSYREDARDESELIDLTLLPPPPTPDELDGPVPALLPAVPPSFADDSRATIDEFIATVTVPPPTVKLTPAVELTPEEIMSYIIPPPPAPAPPAAPPTPRKEPRPLPAEKPHANGDVVRGTRSVSEIRTMFTAKTLSDARNSLLLKDKRQKDSPKGRRKAADGAAPEPAVDRKGVFSCCGRDAGSGDETDRSPAGPAPEPIPDVCGVPPRRPPKQPRPRSNSFTCQAAPLALPPRPPLPPVPGDARPKVPPRARPALASIGSPHFQRNLSTYRTLEDEHRLMDEEPRPGSMTLGRHARSRSEPGVRGALCSPPARRRPRPDLLRGANHVRFKDMDDIPPPPSPPARAELAADGRAPAPALLRRAGGSARALLPRLTEAAARCERAHAHGGGEEIDEDKFQRARGELTSCAVGLVGASRALVGALGAAGAGAAGGVGAEGAAGAAAALADCLTPLRRLADLAQALTRHTAAPLQTRNLVLRVRDVLAAFAALAGADTADLLQEYHAAAAADCKARLDAQLALRAEGLANVLATLLRSLRVFSP